MDRVLKKKPFVVKYRNYLLGGVMFVAFLVYVVVGSLGGKKLRIDSEKITIEEVKLDKFLEYVDSEGIVHPIMTLKVNTQESGILERIVADEGSMLEEGDTILIMTNPELVRSIEDQKDDFEKQLTSYREREIEMEQRSLTLKQQTLQANYELKRLKKSHDLDLEEFNMGVKSKAQMDVSKEDYDFNVEKVKLQLQSLHNDSIMAIIRHDLMKNDIKRERLKFARVFEKLDNLVVRAPVGGQLSFVKAVPGQRLGNGESIGEIKVLDSYKIHTSLSEYYIDRVTTNLPATITFQNKKYPLRVSRVVPEVKDRNFEVDLVFTDEIPDNVRIGKSYRVQIELGQPEEVVMIPKGNFFQYTGGQWIFKVDASGSKAIKTPITIGRQNPKQYEILEGLTEGDKIITSGYDNFGDVDELILK